MSQASGGYGAGNPTFLRRRTTVLWLSVPLYFVSFVLPVTSEFDLGGGYGDPANIAHACGWQVFCSLASVMWIPLVGISALVWLANPFFWIECLLFALGRWRAAVISGCMSMTLALAAAALYRHQLYIGYFVWLASIILMTSSGLNRWMTDGPKARCSTGSQVQSPDDRQ